MSKSIIRLRNGWTAISNAALFDTRLSGRAKGIFAVTCAAAQRQNYFNQIAKNPEDIKTLSKADIKKLLPNDGRDAFQTGWDELKHLGYLVMHKESINGTFVYEWEIVDEPEQERATTTEQKKTDPLCNNNKNQDDPVQNASDQAETEQKEETQKPFTDTTYGKSVSATTYGKSVSATQYNNIYNNNNNNNNNIYPHTPKGGEGEKPRKKRTRTRKVSEDQLLKIESVLEPVNEFIPEDVKEHRNYKIVLSDMLKDIPDSEKIRAMKSAYNAFLVARNVGHSLKYFCTILKKAINNPTQEKQDHSANSKCTAQSKKPSFNDFEQRDYDYTELMKQLGQG